MHVLGILHQSYQSPYEQNGNYVRLFCIFSCEKKEKEMQKYANQRIQIYTAILELYFDFGRYSWIFAAILSAMLFNDMVISSLRILFLLRCHPIGEYECEYDGF